MGLFDKLNFGLKKTKGGIFGSITKALSNSQIDDDMYEDLLDQLILADVGYETSQYLVDELERRVKKEKIKTGPQALELMKQIIEELLSGHRNGLFQKAYSNSYNRCKRCGQNHIHRQTGKPVQTAG